MSKRRSIWPIVIASAAGILILSGLGVWQLQRLAQKQTLLAQIEYRSLAEPVDLSEALRLHGRGENVEFMKVSANGRFLHDSEKHLIGGFDGNPAWEVVTPLVTPGNILILVDRGIVPDQRRDPATREDSNPTGDVEVTGIIRSHRDGRGPFSPDNDTNANMWFWWDVPAMLASTTMPGAAKPAPFVLHVVPIAGENGFPRPVALQATLPNNHLQYAITWFALALVLAVMGGLFIRGQIKKSSA